MPWLKNWWEERDDSGVTENADHEEDHGRHGGHNPHPADTYDEVTGLTKHEREVFEKYLSHKSYGGLHATAKDLDMNRNTVYSIVRNVKEKLGYSGNVEDIREQYEKDFKLAPMSDGTYSTEEYGEWDDPS